MKQQKTHTLSILVANKPGVLVRVALTFARRGYNIDSLVVSPVYNPKFSRITIAAKGDPTILEQIIKQLNKLIDIIHASEHNTEESVDLELSLLKLKIPSASKAVAIKHIKKYKAKVIDQTNDITIIAHTGKTAELDELEKLMKKYGLLEIVRTGKLLMIKGKETT